MERYRRLLKEALEAAQGAKAIAQKAEDDNHRDLTDGEKADYGRLMQLATQRQEEAKSAKADAELLEQAAKMAEEAGLTGDELADLKSTGDAAKTFVRPGKSLGQLVVAHPAYLKMLDDATQGQGTYEDGVRRIPAKTRIQSAPIGMKSLFTGASDTSAGAFVVPEQSGIYEPLGRRPLMLRDVISVRRTQSDLIEYVVQTSHTNNAASVKEATSAGKIGDGTGGTVTAVAGGRKPEGAWAFEKRQTAVVTIAEWVPASKRALADAAQLEGLIEDELKADVMEAEENQIVSGDGEDDELLGMLEVSGTQGQAFDTDIFVSVRKALTKVRTIGRAIPNAVGLNPEDVERVDLARDGNDRFYGAGPFAMGPRTLWGVPILESEAFPAGTAVVADFKKTVLWDREQASVTFTDSHEDFFVRNLVAALGEERVALGHTRPSAICVTDVAA